MWITWQLVVLYGFIIEVFNVESWETYPLVNGMWMQSLQSDLWCSFIPLEATIEWGQLEIRWVMHFCALMHWEMVWENRHGLFFSLLSDCFLMKEDWFGPSTNQLPSLNNIWSAEQRRSGVCSREPITNRFNFLYSELILTHLLFIFYALLLDEMETTERIVSNT